MKKRSLIIIVIVLIIDQLTKYLVTLNFNLYESMTIIPGLLDFTYVRNTGAAWSILEGKMLFFYICAIGALIVMYMFYRHLDEYDKIGRFSISLMMAGTIGNLIDRVIFKYVIDFIDVLIFTYDFPVFNVADMALCIGVGLLIIQTLLESCGVDLNVK